MHGRVLETGRLSVGLCHGAIRAWFGLSLVIARFYLR